MSENQSSTSKVIYAFDPDSDRHGVSVWRDGNLAELHNLNTIELYVHIVTKEALALKRGLIEFHMENPKGVSSSSFHHKSKDTLAVKFKKSENVGMVKQAQTSLEQLAELLGVKVVLHRNSKMWKKDKALFEKITGWTGRSNEETRSSAWMGYQAVTRKR